jgi:type IV pilus assembly protein PilF
MRRKSDQEAVDYLERALRLDPGYLGAMLPLAEARYRRGDFDAARSLVTRYNRAVNPTAESLWLALRIERRMGDRVAENSYAEQLRRRFSGSSEFQSLQKGVYE